MNPIPSSSPSLPSSELAALISFETPNTIAPPLTLPSPSYSDDIEALQQQDKELTAARNKLGIVIQHRAWALPEVFRSEDDYHTDSPSTRRDIVAQKKLSVVARDQGWNEPSSSPLRQADMSTTMISRYAGGFLVDDDDEEEDEVELPDIVTQGLVTRNEPVVNSRVSPPSNKDSGDTSLHGSRNMADVRQPRPLVARTCSGKSCRAPYRSMQKPLSFEEMVAARSVSNPGRAKKAYYGIDIHELLDLNSQDAKRTSRGASQRNLEAIQSVESGSNGLGSPSNGKTLMWTEKYRARKFTDLVGDERTHRSVLRWLKGWDPIVFPSSTRQRSQKKHSVLGSSDEKPHKKVLLLHGPPGLGKTTLAHVCARQAGYEVLEINASDERSRDVVRGRIKDIVGTENVRAATGKTKDGKPSKANRPVCVVVDEVDGVVSGSGGSGEGGFIKALIDLILLDQRNREGGPNGALTASKKQKKSDKFRLLRPLVLVCNDVFHQSLRPLRQSGLAEIINLRKPPLNMVVTRMKTIFEKEGVACDTDAVRRLCEVTWGISSRKESSNASSNGEGDIRGILVVGEWVASKLRASSVPLAGQSHRLTRRWLDDQVLKEFAHGGTGARSLGRGNAKDVVERVFADGGGFPKTMEPLQIRVTDEIGGSKMALAEAEKKRTMELLREMIDTTGEYDRILTDCFASYPSQPYQDDTFLTKPSAAYDWLHFHDTLSSKVYTGQEWELNAYLNQPILAFHHLFACPGNRARDSAPQTGVEGEITEPLPFTGPRADFTAREAEKQCRSSLLGLQSSLSLPLLRLFRSPEDLAVELAPFLTRLLAPDVHPVVVGGSGGQQSIASVRKESERDMVQRAVGVMNAVGVKFDKTRVEIEGGGYGGFIYRMEPPLDSMTMFETASSGTAGKVPVRYAVRQVLEQEYYKEKLKQRADVRQARYKAGDDGEDLAHVGLDGKENGKAKIPTKGAGAIGVKRDFFGRIVNEARPAENASESQETEEARKRIKGSDHMDQENPVWVSFHEGFSNAVRRPITLEELLRSF